MLQTTESTELTLTVADASIAFDGADMLANCHTLLALQTLRQKLFELNDTFPENGPPQTLHLEPREYSFLQLALHCYQLSPEIELEFKLQAAQFRCAIP